MVTKRSVLGVTVIITVLAVVSLAHFPTPVAADCSGNPHDFDSGPSGNPHDVENGSPENGNPHDLVGDFHHHQFEGCPGAK